MTATLTLNIHEILRLARERAELKQAQLGARIEMGRTTVIRYEGTVTPQRWADVLRWLDACRTEDTERDAELREAARIAWEEARKSGCIYEAPPNLFDFMADPAELEGRES